MIWLGTDLDKIGYHCERLGDRYRFTLGKPIQVTTTKRKNVNRELSALSKNCTEDKFMLRYTPNNEIYFDADFVEGESTSASVSIDTGTSSVVIGSAMKSSPKGVLVFSHSLALTGQANDEIRILGNTQTSRNSLLRIVQILAVGYNNGKLFGLFQIPVKRGIALWKDGMGANAGFTVLGRSIRDCTKWSSYTIDDWFTDCKVEVE